MLGDKELYLINGSLFILVGIISYLLGRVIIIVIKLKKREKMYWLNEFLLFLFAFYGCMVVSVTLFPLPIGINSNIEIGNPSVNLVPFKSIIYSVSLIGVAYDGDAGFMIGLIVRNVGGNILLLMPLGFLIPILWNKFRHIKYILLVGCSVSVSIELLQYLESRTGALGRVTDIDDVFFNVLGVAIGYLSYKLFLKIVGKFLINNKGQSMNY